MTDDIDDIDDYKSWRLETAGASLHYFVQRCAQLFTSPVGGSLQSAEYSESQATVVVLMTGAVLDILRTNPSAKGLQMIETACPDDTAVTLTLTIAALDDRHSAGLSLLNRASHFCEVRDHKDRVSIVARITGKSLQRAFDDDLPGQRTG